MKLRATVLVLVMVAIMFASMGATAEAARDENACEGKNKKECEVPEVPWTLVLPVASIGLAGAGACSSRRRHRDDEPRPRGRSRGQVAFHPPGPVALRGP